VSFLAAAVFAFFFFLIGVPVLMFFARLAGLYVVVRERTCRVYVLFGNVVGILDEPGAISVWHDGQRMVATSATAERAACLPSSASE
jgi:hypothetical protein